MDKFIKEISSPYWWIGVVIIGIAINIASSYLKNIIEFILSRISNNWKLKQKERTIKTARIIDILKNKSELKVIYALRELRYRIRSISFLILWFSFLASGFFAMEYLSVSYIDYIAFIIGLITILLGLTDHREAMKVQELIESSIEGLNELDT
jgi:hypothetical protein